MWTKEHRERQKAFERRRYPTDLTDEEWERIRPILPQPARRGRRPKVNLREILNAIRHLARTGCGWRMPPHEFGAWQTVYWWFRRFVRRLLFPTLRDVALMLDRERSGREASPTAGVTDSQTVKSPSAPDGGGYDAAKKVKGRKRHIAIAHGWASAAGQPYERRCAGCSRRRADHQGRAPALALAQAPVCRRGL